MISYPAGFFSDRWGRRSTLLLSFLIFFISYLGFARARSIGLIASLFVFYGLFQGTFRTVGKAFASDFVPEHLRASGLGWYSTTVGLLGLVASVIAGLLWDRVGHVAVFYYSATCSVVGSIGLILLAPNEQEAREVSSNSGIETVKVVDILADTPTRRNEFARPPHQDGLEDRGVFVGAVRAGPFQLVLAVATRSPVPPPTLGHDAPQEGPEHCRPPRRSQRSSAEPRGGTSQEGGSGSGLACFTWSRVTTGTSPPISRCLQ